MKKSIGLFLTVFAAVLALAAVSFAANAVVTASVTSDDVHEINNMTPGSSKTFLGTRLQGPLQIGSTTSSACATSRAACNTVATTETTAVTVKTTGANWGESFALADGYPNQVKTYVLATDGGQDFYVTPTTKTGFTSVQLNDVKDSVSLKFVDSTVGWVVIGNSGATIN